MKIEANRPCFICGSYKSELFLEKKFPEHGYTGKFALRKCQSCGLLFNSPRLSQKELSILYGTDYYFFHRDEKDEFKRIVEIYHRTIKLIRDEIRLNSVLEIGSAKGFLLAVLKQLGWEVQGIELSPYASRYASKRFGVPTFAGAVEEYVKVKNQRNFSLVLAIDVIEHVLDPKIFIDCIHSMLSDEGILIIDTPNGSSCKLSTEKSKWKGFNPYHIYFFSVDNITKVLTNRGFSIQNIFTYDNNIQVNSIESHQPKSSVLKLIIKKALKKVNLLQFTRSIYHELKLCSAVFWPDDRYLLEAVEKVKNLPIYSQNERYIQSDAKECQKNNMVIIAKKKT